MARLLATRVSPSDGGQNGGTELGTTVTTSALQDWSSTQMKTIEPGQGEDKTSQKQLTSVAVNQSIDREISDGILLVVLVRIQGHEYRALIDSGATRSFISPACITETGMKTQKNNTFLELGNGSKVLSKFEAMDIPVVIARRTFKIDFTVSDLLHNVDIVLGITWLKQHNPLVDWSSGTLYILDSHSLMRLFGEWLHAKYKIGTVKLLYSHEDLEALKNPAVTVKIQVIANPRFWQFENCRSSFSFKGDEKWKSKYCTLRIDHPVACTMKVKRLVNHAKLPTRGRKGAAGYDLHAAEKCVIPANSRGVVKTGIAIEISEGLYAKIAPRSGLSVKKLIDVGAGVVDRDYRGEIGVVMINHSSKDFELNVGDRIAQMILEQIKTPEVEEQANLDQTERGEKGFGSTGTNEMKNELIQEKVVKRANLGKMKLALYRKIL